MRVCTCFLSQLYRRSPGAVPDGSGSANSNRRVPSRSTVCPPELSERHVGFINCTTDKLWMDNENARQLGGCCTGGLSAADLSCHCALPFVNLQKSRETCQQTGAAQAS